LPSTRACFSCQGMPQDLSGARKPSTSVLVPNHPPPGAGHKGIDGPKTGGQGAEVPGQLSGFGFMGQGDVEAAALHGLQPRQHRRQPARGGAQGQVHPVQSQLLQGGVVHGRRQAVPHRIAQHRHQATGPTDAGPAPAALLSQGAIPRLDDGESAGVRRSGRGLGHGVAGGLGRE
jgi:hypothetical protein